MATKTTQTRRPRSSKAAEDGANIQVDETDSSNGEVRENKSVSGTVQDESMLNLAGLKDMSISELTHIAKEMGIDATAPTTEESK